MHYFHYPPTIIRMKRENYSLLFCMLTILYTVKSSTSVCTYCIPITKKRRYRTYTSILKILSSNQSQCSAVMLFHCKFCDVFLINIVYCIIWNNILTGWRYCQSYWHCLGSSRTKIWWCIPVVAAIYQMKQQFLLVNVSSIN